MIWRREIHTQIWNGIEFCLITSMIWNLLFSFPPRSSGWSTLGLYKEATMVHFDLCCCFNNFGTSSSKIRKLDEFHVGIQGFKDFSSWERKKCGGLQIELYLWIEKSSAEDVGALLLDADESHLRVAWGIFGSDSSRKEKSGVRRRQCLLLAAGRWVPRGDETAVENSRKNTTHLRDMQQQVKLDGGCTPFNKLWLATSFGGRGWKEG